MARRKKESTQIPGPKCESGLPKKLFENTSTADVASELGTTVSGLQAKASALGLWKTNKYLKSVRRNRHRAASLRRAPQQEAPGRASVRVRQGRYKRHAGQGFDRIHCRSIGAGIR